MPQDMVSIFAAATRPRYAALTRPRLCRQCGTEVSRSTRRCPTCGQPLSLARHA